MTRHDLLTLLDGLDDTLELVFDDAAVEAARRHDELFVAWSAARAEANLAYDAWRESRSREAYAVYLAAEDRADAAEEMLRGVAR